MKLTKYLLFACTAMVLASCSNDDDWNSDANVTVQMADATLKVKENAGMFYVPVEVTGEANGPVRVTVEVAEQGSSPAVADKHYILTSSTIVIPAGESELSFEFSATNDMDINDDRTFTVTIVSAEGAKIGDQRTTEVTITDDDSLFYEALQGKWTFNYINSKGVQESYNVTLYGVSEGEEGYEETLYLSGLQGYTWVVTEVLYSYDAANNKVSLTIPYGQYIAYEVDFGDGPDDPGVCDIVFSGLDGNYVSFNGEVSAEVSSDLRTVTFDPEISVAGCLFQNNEFIGYTWFRYSEMTMTR